MYVFIKEANMNKEPEPGISEFACASVLKLVLVQNLSHGNEFDLPGNEPLGVRIVSHEDSF